MLNTLPVAVAEKPALKRLSIPRSWLALTGILMIYTLVRCWLLLRGIPTPDSDEATIGLMAMHILHGELPTFFWGQTYMGSLEAFLMAPFFWLFGPSAFLLHFIPLLLGAGFLIALYALGSRIASPRVGLLSTLSLAIGPPFFVILGVRAYGGYIDTLLLGCIILLLALRGGTLSDRQRWRNALWLGLVAGLAIWTNLLVLPLLLAAALILHWQRRADLARQNALPLLGGLLIGAAPAIVYNILHQGATVATILGYTVVSQHQGQQVSLLTTIWQNCGRVLAVSLPILTGGPGGMQSAGITSAEDLAIAQQDPLAFAVGAVLTALALGLGISAAWRIFRARRHLWATPGNPPDRAQIALQGQAALLCVAACSILAPLLGRQDVFAMPRYFFPVYIATPALLAEGGRWLSHLLPARHFAHARWAVAGSVLLALLAWNLTRIAQITPAQTAARDHGTWIASDDSLLIQRLRASHAQTVLSNDYWEGLRLTFEAKEAFTVIMVKPHGVIGFNRYTPYVTAGLRDPRPAYLELTGTEEANILHTELQQGSLPGYTAAQIGLYTVFLPGA